MKRTVRADDYDGAVYWEGHDGDYGENFFSDTAEVREYCEREDIHLPRESTPRTAARRSTCGSTPKR